MNSKYILTPILQDTPGGKTVICTSVIEALKTHIFTTERLMSSTLNSKTQITDDKTNHSTIV